MEFLHPSLIYTETSLASKVGVKYIGREFCDQHRMYISTNTIKHETRRQGECAEPTKAQLEACLARGLTCWTAVSKIGRSHDLFKLRSVVNVVRHRYE